MDFIYLFPSILPLSTIASINPWIKAKLLFGNTGRVDVLLSVLTEAETAPSIARKTGSSQKGVWNILTDLEDAGVVTSRQVLNKREFMMSEEGMKRFSFLSPGKRGVSFWKEWREMGYYLHHISKLPDNASPALLTSEELRISEFVGRVR